MGRIYTVVVDNGVYTNAGGDCDLLEILPATQKPTELIGFCVTVVSEEADTADEIMRFKVIRGHTSSGNGSATTPRPLDSNDAAYGGTTETIGATIASSGTAVDLMSDAFQNKIPYQWGFPAVPDGLGFRVQNAELLVIRGMDTPADDISVNMTFWIREL